MSQPNLVRETEYESATGKRTLLDDWMEIDPNENENETSKRALDHIYPTPVKKNY